MKFTLTRTWFRWLLCWIDARRCLAWAGNQDRLAAILMFHLNRDTHGIDGYYRRPYIYALKSRLIEHLYRCGFCTSAALQVQDAVCWRCNGSGVEPYGMLLDDDEPCEKCGGSGIYARHELYRFSFDVAGQRYTWHQPRALVAWPVQLTDDQVGQYEDDRRGERVTLTREQRELYYVTLYEYLRRRGLLAGLGPDRVMRAARRAFKRIGRLLKRQAGRRPTPAYISEDEIPF
jgi:hypothetical protein